MKKPIAMLLAGVLLAASAVAAAAGSQSDAQARYRSDRAACMSGETSQDRATCLREAGAALREAMRGGLAETDGGQYEQNRLVRCDPLPTEDRHDCVRRMHGEGTTTGSIDGGGIYRELVTPVVPR